MITALTILAVLQGLVIAYAIWLHVTLVGDMSHFNHKDYDYRRRLKRLEDIILPHNFDIEYTKRLGPTVRKIRSLVHTRHKEYTERLTRLESEVLKTDV